MRPYDSATLTQLGKKRAAMRYLLRFDLDSGSYGFWVGTGSFVYEGVTYVGAGKLLDIEELGSGMDFATEPFKVSLSSKPNSALTPDVLATVYSEGWHQRPAVLYKAFFHPRTRALLSVERVARRIIDTLPMEYTVGGQAKLTAFLEPVTFDNPNRGYMVFGDADQRRIDPSDGFLSFAATAGEQPISWGRGAATSGAQGS